MAETYLPAQVAADLEKNKLKFVEPSDINEYKAPPGVISAFYDLYYSLCVHHNGAPLSS